MAINVATAVRLETIVREVRRSFDGQQILLADAIDERLNELRGEGEIRCLTPLWITIDHESEKVIGTLIVEVVSSS